MSDLDISGGVGGIEVAVADLGVAAAVMQRASLRLEAVMPAPIGWDLRGPGGAAIDLVYTTAAPAIDATADLAAQVAAVRSRCAQLRTQVGEVSARLRELAYSTTQAAAAYDDAERRARVAMATMHAASKLAARKVFTELGRRSDLLTEGTGWQIALDAQPQRTAPPMSASVSGLLGGISDVGADGKVMVTEIPVADGSRTWVVHLGGTRGGIRRGDPNPMDWPANVSLMLEGTSAASIAASMALQAAQAGRAGPRDRVILVGYSQGGLAAAALAADPQFSQRYRVTHVVSAGAPIDGIAVPRSTSVLSIQHNGDLIPKLDAASASDRQHWVTVAAAAPASRRDHAFAGYRATAGRIDRSSDVSIKQWRADLAPALTVGPSARAIVHEFNARRQWQNQPP